MQEESLPDRLRRFMQAHRLSQKAVASAAGVSQSAVSRILRHPAQRQGKANSKLCIYMQLQPNYEFVGGEGVDKVLRAFESIWDKSERHALAIARIIKASHGLLPAENKGEDGNA